MTKKIIEDGEGLPKVEVIPSDQVACIVINKIPPRTRPIDLDELQRLAIIQCTDEEICYVLRITADQLAGYSEFVRYARLQGKTRLRKHLWDRAFLDDKMAIHLSKHILNMRDEVKIDTGPSHITLAYNLDEAPK